MTKHKSIVIACVFTSTMILLLYKGSRYHSSRGDSSKCCQEHSEECRACQKEEISINPAGFESKSWPWKCCQGQRKECLACITHVTVDEFCKINPGHYECESTAKNPDCCADMTKECLSCVNKQSVDEFCNSHTGKFGCVGEIMIGIVVNNQIGYMEFTGSVWKEYHGIRDNKIHLFVEPNVRTNKNDLKKFYGENVRVIPFNSFTEEENIYTVIEYFAKSSYGVLVLANVETIVLKDWKKFIDANIHNNTDGFLSLYHSSVMHNYTVDCENIVGDLCVGDAVGLYGVVLTNSAANIILKNQGNTKKKFKWKSLLTSSNIRLLYPPKSHSMQIGLTNQTDDSCGQNEVAYRFNRCEFPDWIKRGIEFYFDRCTSSSEYYKKNESMIAIEKEGRFWTRPVISYCLYGKGRRYTQIARENARRAFSIYPGWKLWIYTDGTVPEAIMQELCEFDVRFIDMSQSKIESKMSWRFLVASEPVKMYAIRDVDSWLLPRGKAAVDEWIASGRKFHNMRDHPNHSRYPMSGGMWGGLHDAIPNMRELLESRQMGNAYMTDMNFLNGVIWKIASQSVWTHDSHSLHKFGEDHPFPTEQKGPKLFVGNVVLWPPPKD